MKLILLNLEVCHENPDGVSWYAYVEGDSEVNTEELREVYKNRKGSTKSLVEGGRIGILEWENPVEVPNNLSKRAGLRRWYVASAG